MSPTTPRTLLVDTGELHAHRDDPGWVVFDCRHDLADAEAGRRAYAASHLPGARFAHLDDHLSAAKTGRNGRHPLPEPQAFARWLGEQGVGPGTQVVAYDASGGYYAARLWWMLRWLGHEAVAVLDGGFPAWERAGLPLTAQVPQPTAAGFVAHPRESLRIDAAGVLATLGSRALQVVDARTPERFAGRNETLDPVGGHIPGAINRLFQRNLASDGRFKPASVLREEFSALLGDRPPAEVVHQCGSGVTACHNLLAMEVAGLTGSRLYPGSWSEWCADPARPVARGQD
jgi:thiosulfate/3-mercaptopyruvate sulfurtransferase